LVVVEKFLNLFFSLGSLNNSAISGRNYAPLTVCFLAAFEIPSSFALPLRTRNREETAQGFQKYFRFDSSAQNAVFALFFNILRAYG